MSNEFKFEFSSENSLREADDWIRIGERDFRSSPRRLLSAVSSSERTPEWADDLLHIARAVYLADKRAPRKCATDRWTRSLHLSVQVADGDLWEGRPLEILNSMLRALTSDTWYVTVNNGASTIDSQGRLFAEGTIDEVALFSGGLDSSAYATERSLVQGGTLLLIGHDFAGAHVPQDRVCSAIQASRLRKRDVTLAKVRDEPTNAGILEGSTRSRGFLFAATGIFVASAYGLPGVSMPENGQLAINPPLTPGRLAACSTRSTHPWILNQLNELVASIGGDVAVRNPFLLKTKGDVCKIARNSGLSDASLACTVSCGQHSANRGLNNCGYCYPCLIRRAGMHAACGEDPTSYKYRLGELFTFDKKKNLLDLQRWLSRPFTMRSLIEDMPLPPDANIGSLMATLGRGREELTEMLRSQHQWSPVDVFDG